MKEYLEKELSCPISLDLLNDPIIASDGFTYSKENESCLKKDKNSPITRELLRFDPVQNKLAKNLVEFFKK
jgi:hypothetical protein